MPDDAPTIGTADTVNINPTVAAIPHVKVLVVVTLVVLGGFGAVTLLVLTGMAGQGIDAATKGALIQAWINLAVAASGFWLGSSVSAKRGAGA